MVQELAAGEGANDDMAKLVVGLGNPGKEYAKTRHNVGFWCVEHLCGVLGVAGDKKKFQGLVGEGRYGGHSVYLLFPQTYMNLSGQSVAPAMQFWRLTPADLIVVYDDLDLPPGSLRLREKGGAGGHNGVKSIIASVGTNEFARVRIGIGRPPFDVTVTDYVLSPFGKSERPLLQDAVERAGEAVLQAVTDPFVQVMNRFNVRA